MRQNSRMNSEAHARRYQRMGLPKGMLIAWQSGGQRTVSRVATLGLGGIFIATRNPPPVGEVLHVIFEVPSGEVRARAVVRDSQPGRGMGVEFTAMSLEARARLDRLLRKLLK
ncbi:MAG: PilZ domain-containing protein [Candidatus Acidiferrales bacterium]